MRCFIGIALPEGVREAIAGAVREIFREPVPVSWTAPGNLHITLEFLGETKHGQISAVAEGLAKVAGDFCGFSLESSGGGIFPGPKNPRILWTGFREPLELAGTLQQNISKTMRLVGFPSEERPFHPHVTIGRVRGTLPPGWGNGFLQEFSSRSFGTVPVSSIHLYESRLSKGGAIYSVIREFPLRDAPRHGESGKETAR